MIPNLTQVVTEFINSVLAPVPGFLRGYVVLGGLLAFAYGLGMLGEDDAEDAIDQIGQGIGVANSGLNRFTEVSGPVLASGAKIGGGALVSAGGSVGRGLWSKGGQLVEVEDAPIKIGPLVEIYGVKIGLGGLIAGLLGIGGLLMFSGSLPF